MALVVEQMSRRDSAESRPGRLERLVRRFDAYQQRRPMLALPVAVIRKYSDDSAGILAALLTYYGFLSLFPFLLLGVTVLAMVVGGNEAAQQALRESFLAEFPIIGQAVTVNLESLRARGVGLGFGIAGTLFGSLGASQAAQFALAEIWNVPRVERPGVAARFGKSIVLVILVLLVVGVTILLAGQGIALPTLGISTPRDLLISTLVNLVFFLFVFRLLTPGPRPLSDLWPGALFAAVVWTGLVAVASYLVSNQLVNASQVYGFFGIVLGIVLWLALAAQVVVIGTEINVVRCRRLWPRSLLDPPSLPADRDVYGAQATKERRSRSQSVDVEWWED